MDKDWISLYIIYAVGRHNRILSKKGSLSIPHIFNINSIVFPKLYRSIPQADIYQ